VDVAARNNVAVGERNTRTARSETSFVALHFAAESAGSTPAERWTSLHTRSDKEGVAQPNVPTSKVSEQVVRHGL